MASRTSLQWVGTLTVVTALVLAGCSDGGDELEVSPTTTEEQMAPEPAADELEPEDSEPEAPEPFANPFPTCDEIWPAEQIREDAPGYSTEAVVRTDIEDMTHFAPGPAAKQAIREAERAQSCMWGVENSDSFLTAWQAELPDDTLETLLQALDESDYERAEHADGYVTYMLPDPNQAEHPCPGCSTASWYGFAGNLMIGQSPTGDELPGVIINTVVAMEPTDATGATE